MCVSLLKSIAFPELFPFRCVCVCDCITWLYIHFREHIYTTHMPNIDIVCHRVLLKEYKSCLMRREFIIKKVVAL